MSDPTIREFAEKLVNIGMGLSSAHPVGSKISDLAKGILHALDNGTVAYCDHLAVSPHLIVVPDPEPYTAQENDLYESGGYA